MARRNNTLTRHRDGQGDICSLFFKGGRDEVRKILTNAVIKARKDQGIEAKSLDDMCCFKEDGLPTCREFEKDPSKMTHEVFSRAACVLGLNVGEVLRIRFTREKIHLVRETMKSNKAGLSSALRMEKPQPIADDEIARVYARFKIICEV